MAHVDGRAVSTLPPQSAAWYAAHRHHGHEGCDFGAQRPPRLDVARTDTTTVYCLGGTLHTPAASTHHFHFVSTKVRAS